MGKNDWTEDELIVAFHSFMSNQVLDDSKVTLPNANSPVCQALSVLLGRTPGSVSFKMWNIGGPYEDVAIARGILPPDYERKAESNGAEKERPIVERYIDRPGELHIAALEALARIQESRLQSRLEDPDLSDLEPKTAEVATALMRKRSIILYGPPGTGKTFAARSIARAVAGADERVTLVQFHPGTSYEDFIEGLRPRTTDTGQVTYELTPGPLLRLAEMAREQPQERFVLVIDEINRANLPKVLGELLFLLEYRDEQVNLTYRPEKTFTLPKNLLIIGTMNSADRSVAVMDAALRRRFDFIPFIPGKGALKNTLRGWLEQHGHPAHAADLLDAVNAEISAELTDHQQLGHSYFMVEDQSETNLSRIWERNILPLLEEMFWGDPDLQRWSWQQVAARHLPGGISAGTEGEETSEQTEEA